jgi:hypothetical protein
MLIPSCCDKSGTSCFRPCYKFDDGNRLLQVVPTRVIQAVCNTFLSACSHQLGNGLLHADLLEQLCCESAGLVNLVTR